MLTCRHADFFDLTASFADYDWFMGFAVDDDVGADVGGAVFSFFKFVNGDGGAVGDFFAELEQELFSD